MFTIDGVTWEIPCTIERVSEITSSEISGMLLNKQYFNDVLGTWMRYNITIAVPLGYETDYATLYEILSSPKDGHTFVLPYNQTEITITGRVQVVSDRWVRMPNGASHWRKTHFEVIANHPSKSNNLGDIDTMGMSPLPENVSASEGDTYTYTNGVWIPVYYDDADDIYY